jgi:uncharacterized membrane protein (DUF2068 family)
MLGVMEQAKSNRPDGAVVLIGISKLLEAALLVIIAVGAHKLLHHDIEDTLEHWARAVRVDPDNHLIRGLLTHTTGISERKLEAISVGTFLYAALFGIEGTGLVLRKRWAEYVTVISTAGFLPIEVYELFHHPRLAKVVVLVINALIVVYLVWRLYQTRKSARPQKEPV